MPRKERVIEVIDGDTFRTAARKHPVRLANVDAPEMGSLGGQMAKVALQSLVQGQTVTINTVARDKYARSVANVKVDGRSVNAAMRRKGYK